jgi:hypothetical protein
MRRAQRHVVIFVIVDKSLCLHSFPLGEKREYLQRCRYSCDIKVNSAITYRDEDVLDSTEFRTARFHGSFDPSRDKSRPQFVALVDYERSNPNSLEIRLIWNGDERERADAAAWLRFRKRNHLWLYPVDSNELPVEVLGITSTSHNLHEGTIVATAASFGITDNASGDAAKYQLHVKLQPSGILVFPAIVTHDFTGEITRDPIEDGVIEIATTVGTLVARETHEYTNSLKFGDSVLHKPNEPLSLGKSSFPRDSRSLPCMRCYSEKSKTSARPCRSAIAKR